MNVEKRDGRKVSFQKDKIINAILKAAIEVDETVTDEVKDLAEKIAAKIEKKDSDLTVEEIQDIVENSLMASKRKDIARTYIIYRNKRSKIRENKSELMKKISKKLYAEDVENQNANVDEKSFGGRIGAVSSEVLKDFALEHCISKMARDNHLNNEIYIHDLDHYAVGDHNCFNRDTQLITSEGIKRFRELNDGQEIEVLGSDSKWHKATVKCYGKKPMYNIVFSRAGKQKKVVCTRDHRWILSDGSVTTNLEVGDRLIALTEAEIPEIETERDAKMFCLGFIIGDGTDAKNGFLSVRLCGNKSQYKYIFEKAGYHVGVGNDGDFYCRIKADIGKQDFLSGKVWKILPLRDKQLLFEGYFAADGSKTTNTKRIWTSDERVKEMIEDISCLCGYHIFSEKQTIHDAPYKKDAILYEFAFTTKYGNNSCWKVEKITKSRSNTDQEAWCVEEPETHSFILADGMITGNCLSIPFDDLLASGFNTRQTDVRPANSVNTAFQLVAVIFQLQSLNQFGGVSATHLDWTLVPYVKKSFIKHFEDGLKYVIGYDDDAIKRISEELQKRFDNGENIDSVKYEEGSDENDVNGEMWYYDAWEYAYDMTEKEVYQGAEGLYHNLEFGPYNSNVISVSCLNGETLSLFD